MRLASAAVPRTLCPGPSARLPSGPASSAVGSWPCSLSLRLPHSLIGLVAVTADQGARAGLEDDVLGPRRPRARGTHEHHVRVVERGSEAEASPLRALTPARGPPGLVGGL